MEPLTPWCRPAPRRRTRTAAWSAPAPAPLAGRARAQPPHLAARGQCQGQRGQACPTESASPQTPAWWAHPGQRCQTLVTGLDGRVGAAHSRQHSSASATTVFGQRSGKYPWGFCPANGCGAQRKTPDARSAPGVAAEVNQGQRQRGDPVGVLAHGVFCQQGQRAPVALSTRAGHGVAGLARHQRC